MLQLFVWFRVGETWVEMLLRSSAGIYKKLRVIGSLKLPCRREKTLRGHGEWLQHPWRIKMVVVNLQGCKNRRSRIGEGNSLYKVWTAC
jgi:hypothetical protein